MSERRAPRSRVDIDAIAREVDARRARQRGESAEAGAVRDERRAARLREVELRLSTPWSPLLEGRLLAAMLCEPAVLALCDDVETDDFGDLRYNAIFHALRNAQARGLLPAGGRPAEIAGALTALVADELARVDARDEKHLRDSIDDLFLAELVARHLHETYGPPGSPIAEWVLHDARQLRQLAERRRAL